MQRRSEHEIDGGAGRKISASNPKSLARNNKIGCRHSGSASAPQRTAQASGIENRGKLAKLRGARLVVAQETQKGRRWDETKIKALTGGDRPTARFMRQDFFDFVPTFKLFIAGNHKLINRGSGPWTKRCAALAACTLYCGASARPSFDGASTAASNGSGTGSRHPPCARNDRRKLPRPDV